MTVIARQPELLRQLRAPEGRTLRELGSVFGVSKNTIQRDLDQLSCANFCIREEQEGQLLRYSLDNSASPPAASPAPSAAELAPLLTALKEVELCLEPLEPTRSSPGCCISTHTWRVATRFAPSPFI